MNPDTFDRRRHVLVADDEPYLGRIVQMKLEDERYRVSLVDNGRAALELLEGEEVVDVVLLDILMPGMTGMEVLERVRTLPHRAETPVIVLTAKGQDTDRAEALSLGAVDFFTKPFSPKKLTARLNELMPEAE